MKTLFLWFMLFFASTAWGSFDATYQAYGAGMNLLSADMVFRQMGMDYSITTTSRVRGILSVFLDSKNTFQTVGKIKNNQYDIVDYSMIALNKKRTEKTAVSFAQKQGFIDYQTIMLWLMRLNRPATQTMKVTDGKRDIEMTWVYEGKHNIPPHTSCLYQGEADMYSLSLKVIGGKKRGWFFKRIQESAVSPFRLYFADVNGFKNTLVYSTFDTGVLGTLDICLEEIHDAQNP